MESELRALQRKVFPGGDSKYFPPEITAPAAGGAAPAAVPANTVVTDTLKRMDAVEAQIARITGQVETSENRLRLIEAKLGLQPAGSEAPATAPAIAPATPLAATVPPAAAVSTPAPTAAPANRTAMTGGALAPASTATAIAAPSVAVKPAAVVPAAAKPAAAAAPSAQRLAAVRAIEKPQTDDPGDDEYSYGFRLWEAKFFPEAQQQLKMFVAKYPRHERLSFARNLLGRAYLDEGNSREAASWFLQNYNADKGGARAPDSLLYLAVSMKQLHDTNRACIALAEFSQAYPAEAAGRLKSLTDETRAGMKCNK